MSPDFDPNPRDPIRLFGQIHVVQPHPMVPTMPYAQEAGRAVVYQLRSERGKYAAIKVFKKRYRDQNLLDSVQKLSRIENLQGLRAAERRAVEPSDPAAQKYRNLKCAMLMPWIHGSTWFIVLDQARTQGYYLDNDPRMRKFAAIRLCDRFLEILEGLEARRVAHTDISPGNVMVRLDPLDVQLVDLEDVYMPGVLPPVELNMGSQGYRHQSGDEGEISWRAEGDRYAAAVLAAEMIVLIYLELTRKATAEGFFTDHCGTSQGMSRFREAQEWLERAAPEFAAVFERSWFAESLEGCPTISDLRRPIKELANSMPSEPIVTVGPSTTALRSTSSARYHPPIVWEQWH
jgi:serine/threonine protein kinase